VGQRLVVLVFLVLINAHICLLACQRVLSVLASQGHHVSANGL